MSSTTESKFSIPKRQDLIDRLARSNHSAYPILFAQVALCVFFVFVIDWKRVLNEPWTAVVAVAVLGGPWIGQWLNMFAQKKVEIGKLKEQTRFGEYDKHKLRKLYTETLQKLGLPNDRVPVYITVNKTVNAAAMNSGLSLMFRRFNGIYLDRQTLHMLTPQEVQDTIGHELGHYYVYYNKLDRFRVVSLVLAILGAIAIGQYFRLNEVWVYMLAGLCGIVAFLVTNMVYARHVLDIEYLCDDCGAHANGIEVAINSLLKVGASAELQASIFYESLLSKRYKNMSSADVFESVMRAIPYGHASQEEIQKAVDRELERQKQKQGASIGGFLNYMWNSDSQEEVDEQLEQMARRYQRLKDAPRLQWEQLLDNPQHIDFRGAELQELIDYIETYPDRPLFHEVEPKDENPTHPPIKKRILYLWYNRREIESSPVLPGRI